MLLANARIVTAHGLVEQGWIDCSGATIDSVGTGRHTGGIDVGDRIVAPGFVDMHVHGAVGGDFQSGEPSVAEQVVAYHRSHGTTTLLAGIGTSPLAEMTAAAAHLAPLVGRGEIAGIFYEGPFLSAARRGAHDPSLLRIPNRTELDELLAAGNDQVRMVALAPELPGALDAIAMIDAAGAVAAVGHTDASYEQACAAFDAGATVATHLFNGMRPIHHRDPGPVLAAIANPLVTCELIADGFHLADPVVSHVFASVGPHRVALITDAMSAAGVGDGEYRHGKQSIVVIQGRAMLADGSSLAGSTLTLDVAVRRVVTHAGVPLTHAIAAATSTPARALHLEHRVGSIRPGLRADLVVLDNDLKVFAVMHAGRWVTGPWTQG